MTTNSEYLTALGLETQEQLILETLFKRGESSVRELALSAHLNRSTTYTYLEQLKQKGLIFELVSRKKKFYQPISKKDLTVFIQNKISRLNDLRQNLPELISSPTHQTKKKNELIKVYEGKAALNIIIEQIANTPEDAYYMGSAKKLYHHITGEYLGSMYNKKRWHKLMTTDYLIADWAESTIKNFYQDSGTFTKRRFLPKDFDVNGGFAVFGEKLAIAILIPKPIIILVEEPSLVALFKMAYLALFKNLEDKNIPPEPKI